MGSSRSEPPIDLWFDPSVKPPDLDNHLAGAGYTVRSSDLHHVAQQLETLEYTMLSDSMDYSTITTNSTTNSHLYSDTIHYNPSDLAGWVDSMLSQISPQSPPPPPPNANQYPPPAPAPVQQQLATHMDEDSGIQLVHILMSCAECVQRGDTAMAVALIDEMRSILSSVGTTFGIGKVARYFIDALIRRLHCNAHTSISTCENEILYHGFYEACPYLKFAHFTANQAILEAFEGHDSVHVVDFSLMHGLQWPALIQALALRPGGPPFLRITGIGPPSSDGRDSLRDIGLRLSDLSRSVGVRFAFRGVAANRLDDVKPWMLHEAAGPQAEEAVAVNSVMQLHRLLGDDDDGGSSINCVLHWIHKMRPKIVTVVEQEADQNKANFLDRFTEALFYYSTMFDSLDGAGGGGGVSEQNALAEVYLQREICNVLCCEGEARTERHEPLVRWRSRMAGAGFKLSHLGSNAFKQASMLLTLFSGDGYCVEEVEGCLTLGWHSRPLISASAWRANNEEDTNDVINDDRMMRISNHHNYNKNSISGCGSSSSNSNSSNSGNNNNNHMRSMMR